MIALIGQTEGLKGSREEAIKKRLIKKKRHGEKRSASCKVEKRDEHEDLLNETFENVAKLKDESQRNRRIVKQKAW